VILYRPNGCFQIELYLRDLSRGGEFITFSLYNRTHIKCVFHVVSDVYSKVAKNKNVVNIIHFYRQLQLEMRCLTEQTCENATNFTKTSVL